MAKNENTNVENNDDKYSELFGEKDAYYSNEKNIRDFVIKYNDSYSNKVNKVEWKNNHKIAQLYFDDENCKINDHSEMGYIFTCQFNNGKAKLSDYESILKDLIKTYDSSISDDIISSGMENGRNNNLKTVNITDKVTIEYNYASEPISIRSGDSYIIEMILGK